MSSSARLPQSLCWHEGMLLSPQHFQQSDIYWQAQMSNLTTNMGQYRFGILELAIDEARLSDGIVYITRLLAIMPDGLQVDFDAKYDEPLQLPLSDVQQLTQNGRVKIQLTVPIRIEGSASSKTDIQRFNVCDSSPVKDDNTGEGELVVQRLQPILTLQATEHVKEQYVALPLFEVCLVDGGQYQVGRYCPPLMGIRADSFLMEYDSQLSRKPLQQRLQALALAIRKKARQLAGFSEQGEEQFGNQVSEQHRLWIRAMVQHLPEFELVTDNDISSPWQVYLVMARMIGSICALDSTGIPPKLPKYNHLDCDASLSEAIKYIDSNLNKVNLRYTSLAFDEGRDGVFTITYDKAWQGQDLLIELKPREHLTQGDLVQWLKACRIASNSVYKDLATKRLLGAETEQIDCDDKTGITVPAGHALFYIKVDPQLIKVGQSILITCTNGKFKDLQPKRIVLHLPHESN